MQSTTNFPNQTDAHRLLVQLGSGRATVSYQDNEKIYGQGDEANHVFFVQSGRVDFSVETTLGQQAVIGSATEGHFFGQACLHESPVRVATARTVGDCRITSVTKRVFLARIQGRPEAASLFIDYLAENNGWIDRFMLKHLLEPGAGFENLQSEARPREIATIIYRGSSSV